MDSEKQVGKSGEKTLDAITELVRERLTSPMYFYFIIAWMITNWRFVYSFLFVDDEFTMKYFHETKIAYLMTLYGGDWWNSLWFKMLVEPAIAVIIVVWWLTNLSERVFKRYEEHKMNERAIVREVEYREKVSVAVEERKIREEELGGKIQYIANPDFNQYIDDAVDHLDVVGADLVPSEALYNTDYEAYKARLSEYVEQNQSAHESEESDREAGGDRDE